MLLLMLLKNFDKSAKYNFFLQQKPQSLLDVFMLPRSFLFTISNRFNGTSISFMGL